MKKYIIIAIVILFILFIIGIIVNKNNLSNKQLIDNVIKQEAQKLADEQTQSKQAYDQYVKSGQTAVNNSPTNTTVPSDWLTYVNDTYKFSIKYPPGGNVHDISKEFNGPVTFTYGSDTKFPMQVNIIDDKAYCSSAFGKGLSERDLGKYKFQFESLGNVSGYYLMIQGHCYHIDVIYGQTHSTTTLENMLSTFTVI